MAQHEALFTEDNFYKEIQALRSHRRAVSIPKSRGGDGTRSTRVSKKSEPKMSRLELWLAKKGGNINGQEEGNSN